LRELEVDLEFRLGRLGYNKGKRRARRNDEYLGECIA
jgi:hypothetical protein